MRMEVKMIMIMITVRNIMYSNTKKVMKIYQWVQEMTTKMILFLHLSEIL